MDKDTLESIRGELAELEKQVAELEQARINAATIPAEELLYVHDRIGEMHTFLRTLAEAEEQKPAEQKPPILAEDGSQPICPPVITPVVSDTQGTDPGVYSPEDVGITKDAEEYYGPEHYKKAGYGTMPPVAPPYYRPTGFRPPVRRQPSRKFSEMNFGKYGAAGIAAVLVLLAVIGFAGLVWDAIPGLGKFILIMAAGGACIGFGVKRALANPQNGFWLAISSLGFGICYAAAASGVFVWSLYGANIALILFVAWFAGCFLFAWRMSSRLVYAITYIGGAVCLRFALEMILPELAFGTQIGFFLLAVIFMSFGLYSSGYFSFILAERETTEKSRACSRFVELCNVLLGAVVCALLWMVESGYEGDRYNILLLTALLLFVSAFLIFALIRYVRDVNLAMVLCVLPTISVVAGSMMLSPDTDPSFGIIGSAVCLLITASLWLLNLRDLQLAMWCTGPLTIISLAIFSMLITGSPAAIPLSAAAVLRVLLYIAAGSEREPTDRYLFQKTCWMWYMLGYILLIIMMFEDLGSITTIVSLVIGLAFPAIEYVFAGMDSSRRKPLISKTWSLILVLFALFVFSMAKDGDPLLVTIVGILALALHKFMVLERAYAAGWEADDYNGKYDWARANWMYLVSLWVISFVVDGLTIASEGLVGVTSLAILLLSFCYIYEAVMTANSFKMALMMACSHLHIFMLVFSVGMAEFTILTSILGLALCAVFLYLGFRRKNKRLRVMGLVTMMLYVLKITLVDISAMADSPALTITMLLIGGLVCFGISYAYNKLSAKFNDNEEETE